MTEVPMKLVVNCETGVQEYIPLSVEEIAERDAMAAEAEARRVEEEAAAAALEALKASARAKLVLGQPLTEEEAATLVI